MESESETHTVTDTDTDTSGGASIDDILQECEENFSEILQHILQSVHLIETIAQKVDGSIIHIEYNEEIYTLTDLIIALNEEYSKLEHKENTWGGFVFDKLQQCNTVE